MWWRNHSAVDASFLIVAAFIDKSLGFVESCGLTGMNASNNEKVNEMVSIREAGRGCRKS